MNKIISYVKIILFVFMALFNINEVCARDLGRAGAVFDIKEEGFLTMVQRKLQTLDIDEHKKKMQEIARKKIEEPDAVSGVVSTIEPRSFDFDPTYVLKEDIKLPNGEILYPAGTRVNPLDHMDFDRKLFFIDARDKAQIKWLKEALNNTNKEKRVILVAGRPLDLTDHLGIDVYFDQFGELTTKFGIKQVPSTIEQEEGKKLLSIKEIKYEFKSE